MATHTQFIATSRRRRWINSCNSTRRKLVVVQRRGDFLWQQEDRPAPVPRGPDRIHRALREAREGAITAASLQQRRRRLSRASSSSLGIARTASLSRTLIIRARVCEQRRDGKPSRRVRASPMEHALRVVCREPSPTETTKAGAADTAAFFLDSRICDSLRLNVFGVCASFASWSDEDCTDVAATSRV